MRENRGIGLHAADRPHASLSVIGSERRSAALRGALRSEGSTNRAAASHAAKGGD
jgi:hypothetical protein